MIKSKNFLVNSKYHKENYRRQDKTVFARNGAAIYITKRSKIKKYIFGGNIIPYEMNKFNSVDIDDLEDVKLGEIFLNMKIIFKSFISFIKFYSFFRFYYLEVQV